MAGDSRFEELCGLVGARIEEAGVPGAAVGVLAEGQWLKAGLGVTSVEHPLEVTPETIFQIGSITKTFTGTVAMRLAEDGLLDLDAPLKRYLPELRLADERAAAAVTMRDLLTHTGGWAGDYFDDTGAGNDALARLVDRLDRLEQLTPVGEAWAYNNAGFYLAGRAIEVLTGSSYEAAVAELLLEPLGMTRSFFFPADVMTHRFAVGHITRERTPAVARPWPIPRCSNAAGGLASTVEDMLRYAGFHVGDGRAPDGTRIVSVESLNAMREPLVEIGGLREDAVGVTWLMRERGGKRIVGHGGGTLGQISLLTLVPEDDFAVVVLTNADQGGKIALDATAAALAAYRGIQDSEPEPVPRTHEELTEFAGRYDAQMAQVVLEPQDGALSATVVLKGGFPTPDAPPPPPPPPGRLVFHDGDRVSGEGELRGARGEFLRGAAGDIVWFRFGGRLYRRLDS